MNLEFLQQQSWRSSLHTVPDAPKGMLGREEEALLVVLARDAYEGLGEIIDAGAFLGSSSYCLAKGLAANPRIRGRAGRLHAYDLFTVWHEQGQTDRFVANELKRGFDIKVDEGESTLPIYMRNLGELGSLVRVYAGDITEARWSGRPIELFFIDICKTLPIWRHLLTDFYPSLIPGASIVVHQDYHHPLLPYIHVVQEWLSSYFEIVEEKAHDSAAFFLKDRIPDRVLAQAAQYDFSVSQELRLMDRAIERLTGENRHLILAKAQLLTLRGRLSESRRTLEPVRSYAESAACSDGMLPLYAGMTEANLIRAEAEVARPPPDFSEAGYLTRHDDVRVAVEEGRFQSGFEHWLAYGRKEGRLSTTSKRSKDAILPAEQVLDDAKGTSPSNSPPMGA